MEGSFSPPALTAPHPTVTHTIALAKENNPISTDRAIVVPVVFSPPATAATIQKRKAIKFTSARTRTKQPHPGFSFILPPDVKMAGIIL
jgi:hypothetical protein